ncbi:LD-carboxypeptidase [Candidatus Erwinia dacicola]|uniref:LD-carboxypeptidase n=1 Tax=Candidatus Erwinia dacicola TaxID=252393 RepID=A0A1E7Z1B3_9GAMM|nr:LD-carboxypeptidase [Candidatus Erwinia dacicola]OFC62577.1 LD-carboxypeptidase [Candidatus Erwinia dacicola]RAP70254.1 LD-carboxypeptidase family protein [Candidatus Erwinia dacicola]
MMQVNNSKTMRVTGPLLLLFLSGCTPPSLPVKEDTVYTETPVQKDCSGQKGKIYLIASSSQYDEKFIPEIDKAFSRLCYSIDRRYLDQNPTRLGYVNTDEKRAKTLTDALSDPDMRYLWFVRGGSGAVNLYPALHSNRKRISSSTPKIIIGFSDVTAIHNFVNHELNWPSVHGVVAAYNKDTNEIDKNKTLNLNSSLNEVFVTLSHGVNYSGVEPLNPQAIKTVTGKLDGGNLTLVQSLFSTKYEGAYMDKIMILEDTGVTAKQLDRTLHQIEYNRRFHPRAVVFGQFYSQNPDDGEKSLYREVVQHFADRVNYPVYYYPEFGHGETNRPFLLNHRASILCSSALRLCTLKQLPLETE